MRPAVSALKLFVILIVLPFYGCDDTRSNTGFPIEIDNVIGWPAVTWQEDRVSEVPGLDTGSIYSIFERRPEKTPIALVWLDVPYVGRSGDFDYSRESPFASCTAHFENGGGVRMDCYKAKNSDQPFRFKIDGSEYDLKDGNLFLVATHGETIRIRQTRRDIERIPFDDSAIVEFAKADEEIRIFFAAVSRQDGSAVGRAKRR